MESESELQAVVQAQVLLDPLTPEERVRAFARLLVALKLDVVDVWREAKRLDLLDQPGYRFGEEIQDDGA